MTAKVIANESPLTMLYRDVARFYEDYEPIPETVTSYQGEIVQIHRQGQWVEYIRLHHLGMQNYHLRILSRYVAHPVLEYAIRLALVDVIKTRTPARAYAYTVRIGHMAAMDAHEVGSEAAFTKAIQQVVTSQLMASQEDGYLQAALRFLVTNSVNEAVWGFDESLLVDIREIGQVSTNNYVRVTMLDHEYGPFVQHEVQAIAEGLDNDDITVEERVLVRLLMRFGLRPIQLRLLREEDFVYDVVKEEYYLHVPRVKGKRARHRRKHFTTRGPLESELVDDIKAMIRGNRCFATPSGCERALFMATRPSGDMLSGPFREYACHRHPYYVGSVLSDVEKKLDIGSRFTGQRLHLTAYRFRYTLATTLVLNGYSQAEVAAALDHDSLESVTHYFRYTEELAEYLDATISRNKDHLLASAKWAGFVDEDYPHGNTIRLHDVAGLGKCLKNAPCNYHPAVSCYGCGQFKPFKQADHRAALSNIESLVNRYREASSGPVKQQLDYALDQALFIVEKQQEVLASE